MQGGIFPVMFSSARSSETTRAALLLLNDTPRQSQNESESSLHESKAPAGLDSWDFRHKRACRSVSDELWSVDAVAKEYGHGHAIRILMRVATSQRKDLFWAPRIGILLVDASRIRVW